MWDWPWSDFTREESDLSTKLNTLALLLVPCSPLPKIACVGTVLSPRFFPVSTVVKLRATRRFVADHLLGVLEPASVLQVGHHTGYTPSVTADRSKKAALRPAPG
jgi:hypothetical protein